MFPLLDKDKAVANDVSQKRGDSFWLGEILALVHEQVRHQPRIHHGDLVSDGIESDQILSRVLSRDIHENITGWSVFNEQKSMDSAEVRLKNNAN